MEHPNSQTEAAVQPAAVPAAGSYEKPDAPSPAETAPAPPRRRWQCLNGNTLKMIAIVTMAIDHVGAALIENTVLGGPTFETMNAVLATPEGVRWYWIDIALRMIGRIAFPIFCFLLVEGFFHTHDVKKYIGRMAVFTLISEVPFDLAFNNAPLEFTHQKVFFTLTIGLLTVWGIEALNGKNILFRVLVGIAGCAVATLLHTDYEYMGVLTILVFYCFYKRKLLRNIFGVLLSLYESISMLGTAALAFIPINLYNGERGKSRMKLVMYWFYPVHLLVLYLIRAFIL